jgi:hypothetical protein
MYLPGMIGGRDHATSRPCRTKLCMPRKKHGPHTEPNPLRRGLVLTQTLRHAWQKHGVHATVLLYTPLASGTIHDARYLYIYYLHGQAGPAFTVNRCGIRHPAAMHCRNVASAIDSDSARMLSWKTGCRWPRPDLR